ncbi:MAG: hypothetical protein HZA93_27595 [Verrucomicrobia bacterium]|nr:hypothetical protein [Verrucomicrobiota bacterium]
MPPRLSTDFDDPILKDFLAPQLRDHGCNVEIDHGLWALFAVPSTDSLANAIARSLLQRVAFHHDSGASADDVWTLYYVDTPNRAAALHWLEEVPKILDGESLPASPAHRALIEDVIGSDKPHRAALRLGELHTGGEITAGLVSEPTKVRSLLDRLHQREPLFFSALLTLLNHHLVDLVVLLQQMIPEDVALKNEIVMGGLSRDPFLQSRQDAAAEIRNLLLRYQLINPIDQQKNQAITNPYAVFMDVRVEDDSATVPLDGTTITVPCVHFRQAVRSIRRNLYRGEELASLDTRAPWITKETAHPFRFIKQRLESRREIPVLDALYMLERAVER